MAYPSLEQYNEALNAPHIVLLDSELKQGQVRKNGLGMPLALCGGFALTYTVSVGSKKFALRCFHKESRELERRYHAISARLKQLASPYFLPFEFIPNGIRIHGNTFPVVKMAWAEGTTLAEFLEARHQDKAALQRLRQALAKLATFLEQNAIAHGDIQPENVMVSPDGGSVQLIDYDGLYVDALKGSKATELGQVNFQHPQRTADDFHPQLDRFAFLTLDVALRALEVSPSVWNTSRSEPSAIVFRRNDFAAPTSSAVFKDVASLQGLKGPTENLAKVAMGAFAAIPSLADFSQGRGVAGQAIVFQAVAAHVATVVAYQGAYPVCDATNYGQVLAQVGSRVELIGCIVDVRDGFGRNRKRYRFINFADWRGRAVKLSLWSEGLDALGATAPDSSWKGRWVSVTGLVEPPYNGSARNVSYSHLAITITARGQIQPLTESEAKFRLSAPQKPGVTAANPRNDDILVRMGGSRPASPPAAPSPSSNQQLLDRMRKQVPASTPNKGPSATPVSPKGAYRVPPASTYSPPKSTGNSGCSVAVIWIVLALGFLGAFAR